MTTIYKVITKMENPEREHEDLRTDYDGAISFFDGVKNNPDCISIEVEKWQDSEESDVMELIETVASYS